VAAALLASCKEPTVQPTVIPGAEPDRNAAVDVVDPMGENVQEIVYVDQNWSPEDSQRFYFTPQGSEVLPYSWFLALEQADNETLFRDNVNLARFRYLAQKPDSMNVDGLPVGFVKDRVGDRDWLGVTCAACHTNQIDYQNVGYRIDGGPAMADIGGFMMELTAALEATRNDPAKFSRFATAILGANAAVTEQEKLRSDMDDIIGRRAGYNARNLPAGAVAGYGRVDALGAILNEVFHQALRQTDQVSITANTQPADAPVSYPFLWDTTHHDRVQWIGVAKNGGPLRLGNLGRNVGEVLGVFGDVDFEDTSQPGYRSSVNVVNLHRLDGWLDSLWSPEWPAAFPALDPVKVAAGAQLYDAQCAECHALIDRTDPQRRIQAVMTAADTDSRTADNFFNREGLTGLLAGRSVRFFPPGGAKFPASDTGDAVLGHAVIGTILGSPFEAPDDGLATIDFQRPPGAVRGEGAQYKARPLNGIWATAPYLHNGSVPTLYDLLQPSSQRPATFRVGSRRFDPQHVGFVTDAPGFPEFRARAQDGSPILGDSNVGHEYGSLLSDEERLQLLEYLKGL
jgi:hypothetical protein